jgi:energy-coupling factor transport system permease protein
MKQPLHPLSWALWWLAGVTLLSITRNPFYLLFILIWIGVIGTTVRLVGLTTYRSPLTSPWRFGLFVIPATMLINALNVHIGVTVLWRLPASIPLIGGPITLESLTYGMLNGLVLTAIYALVVLINQVLSVRAIVGLVPRVYYPLAVVITIALTFAPLTVRQLQVIREAQAVRGQQLRRLRDYYPLVLPLLLSGLERALQLAEAMTARGFANHPRQPNSFPLRLSLLGGLLAIVGGLALQLTRPSSTSGNWLIGAGAAVLLSGFCWIGHHQPRTVYRPTPFRFGDWLVIGSAMATIGIFLAPWLDRTSLFYYPYPALSLPTFHPLYGLATWGLLSPAFVLFFWRQNS